jgi:Concanavalin A-like lectin/glucanases superfamily
MNWIIIILAVILVIILWYVYTIYNSTPSVASNIDLSTTPLSITGDKIKGGTSATYAIGCWLYVKSLPATSLDIFDYVVDSTASTKQTIFALNLGSTPTLTVSVATGTSTATSKSVVITNNLPIQTWVHVLVSVSSTYIDTYLNGKLVQSTPFSNPFTTTSYPADNKSGPTFISTTCPVIITGLSRWNAPLDPQTVWSYYAQGNGNAMQQMLGSDYHLNVVFKKDADAHDWKIF